MGCLQCCKAVNARVRPPPALSLLTVCSTDDIVVLKVQATAVLAQHNVTYPMTDAYYADIQTKGTGGRHLDRM